MVLNNELALAPRLKPFAMFYVYSHPEHDEKKPGKDGNDMD
jgi:hypothetical protein